MRCLTDTYTAFKQVMRNLRLMPATEIRQRKTLTHANMQEVAKKFDGSIAS